MRFKISPKKDLKQIRKTNKKLTPSARRYKRFKADKLLRLYRRADGVSM